MADLRIRARGNLLVRLKAEGRMDRYSIAAISVIDIALNLLGGMYPAYDLLGGKHDPCACLQEG
jgi:hypothetical protein